MPIREHLKFEMDYLKFEMDHLKFEMDHLKFEIPRSGWFYSVLHSGWFHSVPPPCSRYGVGGGERLDV